jgi:hypothetical protein
LQKRWKRRESAKSRFGGTVSHLLHLEFGHFSR